MPTDFYAGKLSDNTYFAASKVLTNKSDGTYNLIRLPKYAFVTNVWLNVTTVFAGGIPAMTVGWIGNGAVADANGFMTDTEAAPTVAGLKAATSLAGFVGKYFSGGTGAITCTISGTPTSGICQFFVQYGIIF
jgi:hypothetical protein